MKHKYSDYFFFVFPLLYVVAICVLWGLKFLQFKEAVNAFTVLAGWLVGLTLLSIQLRKTKEANSAIKKEELKKSLQIEAFKEINKAITVFSNDIGVADTTIRMLPDHLDFHRSWPEIFEFDPMKRSLGIAKHISEIMHGHTGFLFAKEANEIAMLEFDHLQQYISFKVDDVVKPLDSLKDLLLDTGIQELASVRNQELRDQCKHISSALFDITCWLQDLRIELMNHFMTDIFDTRVPCREPRDPKYKILTEVAIKAEVEKEAERRTIEAMKLVEPE